MQAIKQINPVVILELSSKEANWLLNIMQNPLKGIVDPSQEHPIDQEYRHQLFHTLRQCLEN